MKISNKTTYKSIYIFWNSLEIHKLSWTSYKTTYTSFFYSFKIGINFLIIWIVFLTTPFIKFIDFLFKGSWWFFIFWIRTDFVRFFRCTRVLRNVFNLLISFFNFKIEILLKLKRLNSFINLQRLLTIFKLDLIFNGRILLNFSRLFLLNFIASLFHLYLRKIFLLQDCWL